MVRPPLPAPIVVSTVIGVRGSASSVGTRVETRTGTVPASAASGGSMTWTRLDVGTISQTAAPSFDETRRRPRCESSDSTSGSLRRPASATST